MKKPTKKPRPSGLPSREDVLAFIGTHKGKAGVREIARAFGLKNADRASLRHMQDFEPAAVSLASLPALSGS